MSALPIIKFLDRTTPPHIVTLVLITGMAALSMSIFLPSLTAMTSYFQTEYAIMQIALSGYLAATAVLQTIVGPFSDRYGRRKIVMGALVIFVLATIGTYFATTVETFLFFRIVQAAVATCMALGRAIVRDMVPQAEAASMLGYVTMGMAIVPMVGPLIGGALEEAFDWHATFIFLGLAGSAVLILCYFDLGETVANEGVSFSDQVKAYPELLRSTRFWGYVLCSAFSRDGTWDTCGWLCDGELFVRALFRTRGDQHDGVDRYWLLDLWHGCIVNLDFIGCRSSVNFLWLLRLYRVWQWVGFAQCHGRFNLGQTTSGRYGQWTWWGNHDRGRGRADAVCRRLIDG